MAKKKTDTGSDTPKVKAGGQKAKPASKKAVAEAKTVKKAPAAKAKSTTAAAKKSPSTSKKAMPVPTVKNPVEVYSRLTDFDIGLFKSGKHYKLYEKFGSHVMEVNGVIGTYFSVWAPNAQYVSVIGNFNYWDRGTHALMPRWDGAGIWEGFIPHVGVGDVYKYFIKSTSGEELEKSDPFALRWELPPRTGSIVADTFYEWRDSKWMAGRHEHNALDKPYSVYEMHVG